MTEADFGKWHIEWIAEDGARISILKYAGNDLLTHVISSFRKPQNNYGEYELRPVYGYDDCFPTVDNCIYPGESYECGDHGALYRQKWEVKTEKPGLTFSTVCPKPEASFTRKLEFAGNSLTWYFEVKNLSGKQLPFLHVMHPLMRLKSIKSIVVPGFRKATDENKSTGLKLKKPKDVNDHLLNFKEGEYEMLILDSVKQGKINLYFNNGNKLGIEYDSEIFPSLGIWWNNGAYPDEDGLRRTECAFEPIPGTCSNLEKSFRDGVCLKVQPSGSYTWKINWKID
jgi:hypothetical protein